MELRQGLELAIATFGDKGSIDHLASSIMATVHDWGEEPCPHIALKKHYCNKCWAELKEGAKVT